jgi:zinc and cadmium transporter
MALIWIYSITSVFLVGLISFIGIFTLSIKTRKLKKVLLYLVSFSAGALFGDAFIHLLPEVTKEHGFGLQTSSSILLGIVFFFVVEKVIHWRHCHHTTDHNHVHPFAIVNLVGDGVHNFLDGLIIGVSYLVSIPVGIATTVAVILHEIPQEIGDFAVLLHGGFTKAKALFLNFVTAMIALLGTVAALLLSQQVDKLTSFLVPFAAGGFIYIAGSDLIPELHKESKTWKSFWQLIAFVAGIIVMLLLLLIE